MRVFLVELSPNSYCFCFPSPLPTSLQLAQEYGKGIESNAFQKHLNTLSLSLENFIHAYNVFQSHPAHIVLLTSRHLPHYLPSFALSPRAVSVFL